MTPEELKAWREKHHVSQSELAQILGVNTFTVSKWERDVQGIPPYLELALNELARRLRKRHARKT